MPTLVLLLSSWMLSLAAVAAAPVGSGLWLAAVVAAGALTTAVGMSVLALYALTQCGLYWLLGALLCGTGAVSAVLAVATLIWRGLGVEVSAG